MLHFEEGRCPVCQDEATLLVVEQDESVIYTCVRHNQFSHRVTLTPTGRQHHDTRRVRTQAQRPRL